MVGFTIYGQPRSKKNSQQVAFNKSTGRRFIRQSDAYLKYEKEALQQIREKGVADLGIDYPVNVRCRFFREDRRRCDLTNLLEAIDDIMVTAGVIADDNYNIIMGHDGSRVFYDKEKPRTEVLITREGEEPPNDDYI